MKKILLSFLFPILIFCLVSCAETVEINENYVPVTIEELETGKTPESSYDAKDFFVYNKKKLVLAIPSANESCDLLGEREKYAEYPTDESTDVMTKRGLCVGMDMTDLTLLYDLCYGVSVWSTSYIPKIEAFIEEEGVENVKTLENADELETAIFENPVVYISIFFDKNFQPTDPFTKPTISGSEWVYQIIFEMRYGVIYNVTFTISAFSE